MKMRRSELEALIRESVEEELGSLNEEELEELLGGLKGMFGGIGAGAKAVGQGVARGAQAVGSAVKGAGQAVGQAVGGAAQKVGSAVANTAQQAGQAVKGAYNVGELKSSLGKAQAELTNAVKLMQGFGGDTTELNKSIKTVSDISAYVNKELSSTGKKTGGSLPPPPATNSIATQPTVPQQSLPVFAEGKSWKRKVR